MARRVIEREVKRERNADATRAAILEAARRRFTADGFGVGVREVAADAKVNVALLNRYFGSKEELFTQVVGNDFDVSALFGGPRCEFGLRLARAMLTKPPTEHDPILMLLRSASHPAAIARFRQLVDEQFVTAVAAWLGGPRAELRATLIAGELLGLAVLRDIVESRAVADVEPVIIQAARAIQSHVSSPVESRE